MIPQWIETLFVLCSDACELFLMLLQYILWLVSRTLNCFVTGDHKRFRGFESIVVGVTCIFLYSPLIPDRAFLGGNTIISDWMLYTMAPSPRWHVILIVEWSWSSWPCFEWNDTVHAKAFLHFFSLHILHDIDDTVSFANRIIPRNDW